MTMGNASGMPAEVSDRISIRQPERLHIYNGNTVSYGAHQVWYPGWMQRMSGCGPTAASNLLWYLAATRKEVCGNLYNKDATSRSEMLYLMKEVWQYVKPGFRGVDRASIFTEGAVAFGKKHGTALKTRVLEIPAATKDEISAGAKESIRKETVLGFLKSAFSDDLPVAFLNLSNGAVRNLDNWHWVTLVSVDKELRAEMYDQGTRQMIDIQVWLATTTGGGAFVVVEPQ